MARRTPSSPPSSNLFGPDDPLAHEEETDLAASQETSHSALSPASNPKRRLVDPTTCERDYTSAEIEFMLAMHEYKRDSGRLFPTWSEVLGVLHGLGYQKSKD